MGYTTKFVGAFTLDKPLSLQQALLINAIARGDVGDNDLKELPNEAGFRRPKNGYFQWETTPNRNCIRWDGGEKFYDYVEWLQWLIDYFLVPWGYVLTGKVDYQGEERDDYGYLEIRDGKVVQVKNPAVDWKAVPVSMRKSTIAYMENNAGDFSTQEWQAWKAAIRLLKETP